MDFVHRIFQLLLQMLGLTCMATKGTSSRHTAKYILADGYVDSSPYFPLDRAEDMNLEGREFDFIILTNDDYLNPDSSDDFHVRTKEDEPLVDALRSLGYTAERRSWQDEEFDWSLTRAVIPRSCWDYMEEYEDWIEFLDEIDEEDVAMINAIEIIEWNMYKHKYYVHLKYKNGINIPDFVVISMDKYITLRQIREMYGWDSMILKPSFSAISHETYKVTDENIQVLEERLSHLVFNAGKVMIVQAFQHSVPIHGEVALVMIGGNVSHAVQKIPKSGDFRVQDDFGGVVRVHNATSEETAFAVELIASIKPMPAFARVDIIKDNSGEIALMELEMIEPELFFRYKEGSAKILADHIHSTFTPAASFEANHCVP